MGRHSHSCFLKLLSFLGPRARSKEDLHERPKEHRLVDGAPGETGEYLPFLGYRFLAYKHCLPDFAPPVDSLSGFSSRMESLVAANSAEAAPRPSGTATYGSFLGLATQVHFVANSSAGLAAAALPGRAFAAWAPLTVCGITCFIWSS